MNTRIKRLVLILVVAAAAGAGLLGLYFRAHNSSTAIIVSGTIEATEAQVSFKVAGRVAQRLVDEGDVVTSGQTIAALDTSDLLIEIAARTADVWLAQSSLDELQTGSRPEEIAQARAAFESAQADEQKQRDDYTRQRGLFARQVISSSEYQRAESGYIMAKAAVSEARATLDLLVKGPRVERIEQARAGRERVLQALAAAQQRLADATLAAPSAGVVLSKDIEPGEYVMPGTPVVTIGDLEHVWLRAYISETDLGRVKLGQRAAVTTDSYPGKKYDGVIAFISSEAEFTPKTVQTRTERVKLVYRIKINLANPAMELKPGMPADGEISLSAERGVRNAE